MQELLTTTTFITKLLLVTSESNYYQQIAPWHKRNRLVLIGALHVHVVKEQYRLILGLARLTFLSFDKV